MVVHGGSCDLDSSKAVMGGVYYQCWILSSHRLESKYYPFG